jgi:hypothetical protein
MSRCVGFDAPCGKPTSFVVDSTTHREEWCACEACAYQAHVYNGSLVRDESGDEQCAVDATDRLLSTKEAA